LKQEGEKWHYCKGHKTIKEIGARRRRMLLLQSNRRLDQEVKECYYHKAQQQVNEGAQQKEKLHRQFCC
jgi:hypothetical protein